MPRRSLLTLALVVMGSGRALATPTLSVNPPSITTQEAGTVQIDVGSVAATEVILRLYVDANGNGAIDAPADVAVWSDVVADNVADWSPNMFSDTDVASGAVTVNVRNFSPLGGLPYAAGNFIWQAEDTFDASTQTVAFSVTQTAQTQSITGKARDSSTTLGVPGAYVLLLPLCEQGDESAGIYSAFADGNGDYGIQVPAAVECRNRVVLAFKPGFMTSFSAQPNQVFDGTSQFTGQDPELTPGSWAATGRIEYASGPQTGGGIPGVLVTAESRDGLPVLAIAFTDQNGDYGFMLDDGSWDIRSPEDGIDTRGAVRLEDTASIAVAGAAIGIADLTLPAANAYFTGTLFDDAGSPLAGRAITAREGGACDPLCHESSSYTRADGTYSIGVVAPASPGVADYALEVEAPLVGLVAERLVCETISAGDTLTGRELNHLTPTNFVTGTVLDDEGQPVAGACLQASAFAGCTGYTSAAVTECDGTYSVPGLDGNWGLALETGEFATLYGGFAPGRVNRSVTLAAADESGLDFILEAWRGNPRITTLGPQPVVAGSHMVLFGYGFSLGSQPEVFFDATPATRIAFRPDKGAILVEVPPSLPAGDHSVTVVNVDTGVTSDPACIETGAGTFTPICTISGTATDGAGAVGGALVVALFNDDLARAALTDINGDYTIGLDAFGDYDVDFLPLEGELLMQGSYTVACDTVQDHLFTTGWQLTGQLIDDNFNGVADADVEASEVGGSGYDTNNVTDADGFFSLIVPGGTFDVEFRAPANSRLLPAIPLQPTVSAATDLGQVPFGSGSLFVGRLVDDAGDGVHAGVTVADRLSGTPLAFAETDTCSGRFRVAMPPGDYGLNLEGAPGATLQGARVEWVTTSGDGVADFDFVLFDQAAVFAPATAPRIVFVDPEFQGQQGQPLRLFSANLAGTVVDVLFSDGAGGFVAGTSTVADAQRAFVVTKIPAGAASGSMKLRVDGLDSPAAPFMLIPGSFDPGGLTVSGTVSGAAGPGTLVGVVWDDPTDGCDEDGVTTDYGVADGAGNYGPLSHPGGTIQLGFFPPAATTRATTAVLRTGVVSNLTVDVTSPTGVAVSVRAIDEAMNPLENVIFYSTTEGVGDQRLTDANGDAVLHVVPGDYFFGLAQPEVSRLIESETQATITGALTFGNQTMNSGVIVGGALLRESDDSPVAGAIIEARRSESPFDFFHESFSAVNGGFHGPVPADTPYEIRVEMADDTLADLRFSALSDPVQDTILYPALAAGPAGFIAGLVRDAGSLAPIDSIAVSGFEDDPLDPGVPGALSGSARTCPDGTYRAKLPVGDHFLQFNDFDFDSYAGQWYVDAFCPADATTVAVTEGGTATADADLLRSGTVSGIVQDNGSPHAGASVCASSVSLGGCTVACTPPTDGTGLYSLALPPATDYVVQAFSPTLGTQCYNGDDGCSAPAAVAVVSETDTANIDFDLSCSLADVDGDTLSACAGDCDDFDANNFPGNAETCDFGDNDCDMLVDDADAGIVGQPTWYFDVDGDGDGDPAVFQQACSMPGGFVAAGSDCSPGNSSVFSGAAEVNDGADNQCPGDLGFGAVDEISGVAGFFNPLDADEFSWPAQSAATLYKVARSTLGDFSDGATTFTTAAALWSDSTQPAPGVVLYYMVRPLSPFGGSWGRSSLGLERSIDVLVNGGMEVWTNPTNLTTWIESTASGPVEQENDPAHVFEGEFAVRLTRTGSGVLSILERNIPLVPGDSYTFSFRAKLDRVEANAVQVRLLNLTTGADLQSNGSWAVGATSFDYALNTSYETFSIPFTVDAGFAPTDEIRVILRQRFTSAVGTVLWLDDVRFEE